MNGPWNVGWFASPVRSRTSLGRAEEESRALGVTLRRGDRGESLERVCGALVVTDPGRDSQGAVEVGSR